MVLLREKDGLDDLNGKLQAHFRDAALSHLGQRLLVSQPENARSGAVQILAAFHQAARHLKTLEKNFDATAAPKTDAPDLLRHLRPQEHFAAIRQFNRMKESLLAVDPVQAKNIVDLVEHDIAAPKTPALKA